MDPRTVIKVELAKRNMTLLELAAEMKVPQQSLSRTLKTSPVNGKSLWPGILESLGLEIVIRPKRDG